MPGSVASVILKAPASCSEWLGGGRTEGGRWGHDVKVPGRGASAWRAVLGGEGATADARRPPLRVIELHQALERRLIGDHTGGPLDNQVKPAEDYRNDAVRILREVPALARPRAAHEVKVAVDPQRTHARDMRPLVGPTGGQPVRVWRAGIPGFRRAGLQPLQSARPSDTRVAVHIDVLLFHASPPYATS